MFLMQLSPNDRIRLKAFSEACPALIHTILACGSIALWTCRVGQPTASAAALGSRRPFAAVARPVGLSHFGSAVASVVDAADSSSDSEPAMAG